MARDFGVIEPFTESQVSRGISFGVSSYGYDISLHDEFKVFRADRVSELDPKQDNRACFADIKAESVLIPPNSFLLARSREYFRIPRDVLVVCTGKSTYARNGVVVNITPLEPEWEGYITIAISNTAPVPVRVYAGEGIAQIVFLEASEVCAVSYKDKKGRYQGQQDITLSRGSNPADKTL